MYLAQDEHSGVCLCYTAGPFLGAHFLCHLAEAIRPQEDTVPDRRARGERGDEGSRSLPKI